MIYIFLADGFEEVEALGPADVLRRAGLEVALVGVGGKTVTGAHKISIVCDICDSDITLDSSVDAVFLPGGMPGTVNLEKSSAVQSAIDFAVDNEKLICAICAAPSILGHKGLLKGKTAICFPGFEKDLEGANIGESFVCRDGNIITAKGMGSGVEFGLRIVEYFKGHETAEALRASLQIFEK
ncbi:MAG: DJ-1/PfpI family protein [Oscillospiraceae bacterium]|nr:DJ-1/PfpI family protein [Oscillospiraceae bacterium]